MSPSRETVNRYHSLREAASELVAREMWEVYTTITGLKPSERAEEQLIELLQREEL